MGDNTERELIEHVAQEAVTTLMQQMIETSPASFLYEPAIVESSLLESASKELQD
jgi:hypothetical protein